jgi:hypothetical protein
MFMKLSSQRIRIHSERPDASACDDFSCLAAPQ